MKGMSIMVANSNSVKSSAMYIGYLILKEIKEKNSEKVSIYDVSRILKKKGINSSRQLVLALSFLYSVDIVEFEEANVWIKK
ncbi:ABC-three component system middle component 6 [Clostridium sp. JN-9]|uniref:ABC-three component system middle component 6 n=1 Tax=Clostridium sp. JN-9 TaxID=2507159 RepID=UPI001FAB2D53|nr:ABC-three component system middle component 6 [Clostridium sp. JN-9]